jgi:hypothetical protein
LTLFATSTPPMASFLLYLLPMSVITNIGVSSLTYRLFVRI